MGYLQGILILISINIVAVCGVIILTGYTGLFSLGHAGFVSIGAYFSAVLCKDFGCSAQQRHRGVSHSPRQVEG